MEVVEETNNIIYSKKTFQINHGNILKNILISKGWKEGNKDDDIDFSYYDLYNNSKGLNAKLMVIPRKITNVIDNKKSMYTTLLKNNQTDYLPKTYTNLKNINPNIFTEGKIFFLKKHNGSGNKDVHVIRSLIEMNTICNNKYKEYILQEEVSNMFLYNNKYKCVIRSYGLIYNNNNYLYNDSKFDIYINEYSKTNTSNSIHNDEWNSVRHENLINMSFNSRVFVQIKNICNELNIFFNSFDSTNNFIILGYDFILDKNFKPYLIEVNTYPNLYESKDQPLKNRMLEDFTDLVIFNNYTKNNGFVDTSKYKQKVYILGGFGSLAGIDISKKLIENYSKITNITNDSDNIPFILDSESNDSDLNETKTSTYNNFNNGMIRAEKYCISNNINNLIMGIGCNTMHLCLENYKSTNNIIFVNMIDCVSNKVNRIYKNYEKIYLLSSYETFISNIYHNKLECSIEKNIKLFPLVKELYTKIKGGIILNEVICNNIITLIESNSLVILGCTELPINLDIFNKCCNNKKIDFIDCNNELAKQLSLKFKEKSV